jgi:4-hydroxybenzoate polyprenyltransferase
MQEALGRLPSLDDCVVPAGQGSSGHLPLVVRASCLVKVDLFFERLAARLRRWRLHASSLITRLLGADEASRGSVSRSDPDYKTLPLDEEFATWLMHQRFCGRQIAVLPDAPKELCDLIADRLKLPQHPDSRLLMPSSSIPPFALLREKFPKGFAYAGRSEADLDIWTASEAAVLCRAPARVAKTARNLGKPILAEFPPRHATPLSWMRMLRPHHWVKNLLLFAPALFGNVLSDPAVLLRCAAGFVVLGIVASCTYLVNDVLDLDLDRQHRSKAARPFASGEMSVVLGFALPPLGLALALAGATFISQQFAVALAAYALLSLFYSFVLKHIALVDALSIAVLYVLRLIMGTLLADVPFSPWLLTFAMLFFFSLVLAKRQTEIQAAREGNSAELRARGYRTADAPLMLALGVASGTASIVVMNLYLMQEVFGQTLYLHPTRLWAVPMGLGVWLSHVWLFAHRGELHHDPIHFALRDPTSLALGLGMLVAFALAIL